MSAPVHDVRVGADDRVDDELTVVDPPLHRNAVA